MVGISGKVKDVKNLLNSLGVDEDDHDEHLERIIESPVKKKRVATPVKLNFKDKASNLLKLLKKAS